MPGTLVITTLSDNTNSTSSTNCIRGSAKAWVNWNTGGGTPTVTTSYNVSSITYRGTGLLTINFTNAFTDANYSMTGSVGSSSGTAGVIGINDNAVAPTSSACAVYTVNTANSLANYAINNAAFFR